MDTLTRSGVRRARALVAAMLALALFWTSLATVAPEHAEAWGPTYVALTARPAGDGLWVLRSDGGVEARGANSTTYGDVRNLPLNGAPLDIAATPTGRGYWILGADGGIFSFGDAGFHGSTGAMRLNKPIIGMAETPSGNGYWLVASDGGIFSFGDAGFHGSTGSMRLNKPIIGMAATPSGNGYWLVATDGGIFSFGDAAFHGSTGSIRLNQPIIDIASTTAGDGYWLTASDGGVFTFGQASFSGAGVNRGSGATSIIRTSNGYAQLLANGQVVEFPGAETLAPRTPPVRGPHAFLFRTDASQTPARWDACAPVRIEVNYAGSELHGNARQTLQQAIDHARFATGLDIRIVGETNATSPSAHADAIIRWDRAESQGGIFKPGVVGWGGGSYEASPTPRIVRGQVIFNGSVPLVAGIGGSNSFGVLALHELGHMLGLSHVLDTGQVMYPSMRSHAGYGNGDKEGLWWLGAEQGCIGSMQTWSAFALMDEPESEPIPFGTWD
jgi:Matrixin